MCCARIHLYAYIFRDIFSCHVTRLQKQTRERNEKKRVKRLSLAQFTSGTQNWREKKQQSVCSFACVCVMQDSERMSHR